MFDLIALNVKDGPQIGQSIDISGNKATLGGKGGGSDIELSGVPHGVQFAELKVLSDKWTVAEFQPKSILLNDRPLKRKNVLKSGDTLRFPSLKKGQSIRYEIALTPQKKQKEVKDTEKSSSIKPVYLIGGISYMMVMILGMLYFALSSSGEKGDAAGIVISEITEALNADVTSINSSTPIVSDSTALSDKAVNFDELKQFINSDLAEDKKQEIKDEFRQRVIRMFSEAWRFEQQERWDAAKEQYGAIITIMGDRHLTTTNIALDRLGKLN